jgi:hypothetical protein
MDPAGGVESAKRRAFHTSLDGANSAPPTASTGPATTKVSSGEGGDAK